LPLTFLVDTMIQVTSALTSRASIGVSARHAAETGRSQLRG
jgi:hypothetical protein